MKVLRPQYHLQLPLAPAPVAGPNDCLVPGSVSTPAGDHRQQPLHLLPPATDR